MTSTRFFSFYEGTVGQSLASIQGLLIAIADELPEAATEKVRLALFELDGLRSAIIELDRRFQMEKKTLGTAVLIAESDTRDAQRAMDLASQRLNDIVRLVDPERSFFA